MPFKVLTHDYRSPLQGGKPIWDGQTLPFKLKKAKLDTTSAECAAGWNYTDDLAIALRIAGLWPDGRPVCCLAVTPSADSIERGDKRRCSQLTIDRRATDEEILAAIQTMSLVFGEHQERMVDSQFAWWHALARPASDVKAVQAGLSAVLEARGLPWQLRRFDTSWDAWTAWAVRVAWNAWDAWDAWAARVAWNAWDAWDARDEWDAQAAWDARDALVVEFAALNGWADHDANLLTTGLRDAYAAGLGIALPVAKDTLGWAMDDKP